MRKFLLSQILLIIFIKVIYGAWPAPPEADYPKVNNIYMDKESVWFYSDLEVGGFPPRHVIGYKLKENKIVYYPISSKDIPKNAKIAFPLKGDYSIDTTIIVSNDIVLKLQGTMREYELYRNDEKVGLPAINVQEAKNLSKNSYFCYINKHLDLAEMISRKELYNSFAGAHIIDGDKLYTSLNGSLSEGIGGFGGLVIYDFTNDKLNIVRTKYLVNGTITNIVLENNKLLLTSVYYGEFRNSPVYYVENGKKKSGNIISYDLDRNQWTNLDPRKDFEDCIIRKLKVTPKYVFLITDKGIGIIYRELKSSKRWDWQINLKKIK